MNDQTIVIPERAPHAADLSIDKHADIAMFDIEAPLLVEDPPTGPIPVYDGPPPPPYTPPPSSPPPPPPFDGVNAVRDVPRAVTARPTDDWIAIVGSALGSLGLVWLLYEQILPFSGVFGFLLCWYAAYLGIYAAVSAIAHPRPVVVDRIASAVVHGGAAVVGLALAVSVAYPFIRGFHALLHINFYTKDMSGVGPNAPLNQGGLLHALIGSIIQVGIAAIVALPLGVGTAIFMNEVGGPLARVVRAVVEAMTALPDILAGLFIYTTLILRLGVDKSGIAVAAALTVMMVPIIARSADVSLRVVPGGLREAGLALGSSRWQTVWRVVIPTSKAGLATALILGIARAVGETAPVIITSAAATRTHVWPFSGPMNSLPLYIYSAVRSGQPNAIERGFAAAAVLMLIVLVLFIAVRLLARDKSGSR